ncbi:MAG: TIGR04086 family membrane protein [Clostridia bacterium]|nr:TIGR04086 family membrane protein [Clostridia bacterium]
MHTAVRHGALPAWASLLRGVAVAVAATAGLVILFALAISLLDPSDGAVRAVNQLIKLAAIGIGVRFAVPRGGERGLLRGAGVGLIYMALGVGLYAALTAQKLTAFAYAADLLMGVAAGGLVGLMRARQN